MDAVSDPSIHSVVLMCSSQIGKTEVIGNVVGYHIDQDPSPILMILPTLELGEAWSKDRLAPMLRDTPCLKGKVKDARSRDSGNTLLHKQFPGGHITIAGANSAASLSSRPVRITLFDEVDRYPFSAGTEGDPVSLGKKRSITFWNRKSIECSTPTIEGLSRIENSYNQSDQRRYFLPCPDCGEFQTLKWDQVHWEDGKPETAVYACAHCGCAWDDSKRWKAIRKGEWRATAPFNGIAGFHLNEIYSSWVKLRETVQAFLESKEHPERLKVWINTALGESWREKGEAPDWQRLYERREEFPTGRVPRGGLFLTAGADVQKDRIEIQVIAWGRGKENWSIDYIVLDGATNRREVWEKLDGVLESRYRGEGGIEYAISRLGIDSGYATQDVYQWARRHGLGRVMVIKGVERAAAPVGQPSAVEINYGGKKIARGMKVWPVAGGIFKSELYGWLRLEKPTDESKEPHPPGYCHFPKYQDEFFKQLTAEQLMARFVKGYKKLEWVKTRERNEALDTWIYARAAASVFGLDRFGERQWRTLEAPIPAAGQEAKETEQPIERQVITPTAPVPGAPLAPRKNWIGGRTGWLKK